MLHKQYTGFRYILLSVLTTACNAECRLVGKIKCNFLGTRDKINWSSDELRTIFRKIKTITNIQYHEQKYDKLFKSESQNMDYSVSRL